jgi:hypothetical protein
MLSWMLSVVLVTFIFAAFPSGKDDVIQVEHIKKSTRSNFTMVVGLSILGLSGCKLAARSFSLSLLKHQFLHIAIVLVTGGHYFITRLQAREHFVVVRVLAAQLHIHPVGF